MNAWGIFGIVLAALALFAAALVLIPGRLLLTYDAQSGFLLRGSVLFFRFGGNAPSPKKKPKADASDPEKQKRSLNLRTLRAHTQELSELLGKTVQGLGTVVRGIVVKELSLLCRVGGDDPAETADTYGRICAFLYPTLAALHSALRVCEQNERIELTCAFGEESRLEFRMLLQLRAIHVVRAVLPIIPPAFALLRGLRRDGAAASRKRPPKA